MLTTLELMKFWSSSEQRFFNFCGDRVLAEKPSSSDLMKNSLSLFFIHPLLVDNVLK